MRILAIRGANLASLPRFEVRLAEGPLGEAGLFAISGPTGAGKSTLLDALCLALYDSTPRLRAEGTQHILRQSAVDAWAEVDFRTDQRRHYRATWRVQRAHRKAGGRWQEQTVRLQDLESGKVLGSHRKRETLRLIEEQVGLSFEQFRRAVLLAQGDFALFLQAKGDERARLLEKITGMEIYGRLSEAAFRCAKEEGERLGALVAEAERHPVLPTEELARQQAEREALRALRAALEAEHRALSAAVAWHGARGRLMAEVDEAAAARAAAQERWAGAAPLREEIERRERAEALRPLLEAADGAARRLDLAREAAERAAERRTRAAALLVQAEAAERMAQQRREEGREAAVARAGELERARALDLRIEEAARRHAQATQEAANAEAALAEERRRLIDIGQNLSHQREQMATLDAWLGGRRALAGLAEQWPRWRAALEDAAAAWHRQRELAPRGAERSAAVARAETEARAAADKQQRAAAAARTARATVEEAQHALDRHRAAHPALQEDRRRLGERLQGAQMARQWIRELTHLAAEQAAARQEAAAAAHRAAQRLEQAALDEQALSRARAGRDRCERDLQVMRAAQELAARRPDLLAPGRPCPLCGSLEHPDAGLPAPADDGVRRLQGDLERLRAEAEQLAAAVAAGREQGLAQQQAADEALRRAQEREQLWRQRSAASGPLLAALGIPPAADPDEIGRALTELERSTAAEDEALRTIEQQRERLQQALAQAYEAHSVTAADQERSTAAAAQAQEALALAEQALRAHQQEVMEAEACWQRARDALSEVLAPRPGWEEALRDEPEVLDGRLGAEVAEWTERTQARALAEERAGRLAAEESLRRESERRLAAAAEEGRGRLLSAEEERAALRRERAGLLGGRAVQAVAAEFAAAEAQAEEGLRQARAALTAAQREIAAAEAAAQAAEQYRKDAEEEHRTAAAQLAEAAARTGMTEDEARRLLSEGSDPGGRPGHGAGVLARLRAEVAALREALTQTEGSLADRRRRLHSHEASQPPSLPPEEAAAALDAAQRRLEEAREGLCRVELTLSQDEQARASRSHIEAGIEVLRRQALDWERLSDLIGSADGKKFRQFAQSLTLDLLLEHSNHHLGQLRPRYRIQRVPGTDMDLQVVDQDMGGEVRSCATLSGGESFLVSLALALGLSSLSSRNVRVESLFIDEGFGTLDRDTLEVAIATLEQLQHSGRQVGLISHVPDLADRIGYQVLVRPRSAGHSVVTVTDGRR